MCCWVNPRDKDIQVLFLAIGIKYYHELRESSSFKWSSCPAPELSRSWMDNSKGNRTPQGEKGGYFQYLWHHKLINLERLCKEKSLLLLCAHLWPSVKHHSEYHINTPFPAPVLCVSEQQDGFWDAGMFSGPMTIQGCRSLLGQGWSFPGAILQIPWWTHWGWTLFSKIRIKILFSSTITEDKIEKAFCWTKHLSLKKSRQDKMTCVLMMYFMNHHLSQERSEKNGNRCSGDWWWRGENGLIWTWQEASVTSYKCHNWEVVNWTGLPLEFDVSINKFKVTRWINTARQESSDKFTAK